MENYNEEADRILCIAKDKFVVGAKEHGSWKPNGRVKILREMKEEIVDQINYCIMTYIEVEALEQKKHLLESRLKFIEDEVKKLELEKHLRSL